jgi:thioredoxin 1
MREITDASFEAEVLGAEGPVVVDFWAPWCGPCRAVTPVLEQLEAEHAGKIAFTKLNIDDNPSTASRYDVFSIPTVIVFEAGEARETVIGARPRAQFERAFARWLEAA